MTHVDLSRVFEYYHGYINRVSENNLTKAFQKHQTELLSALDEIPEEKWDYRYAEGKWSIKEVVQHILDAERIFGYRALCFARKDKTPLPGFDENLYAETSRADQRSKQSLLEELEAVQKSSAQLFASFDEEQLEQNGIANGKPAYVKAIGFILIGHALHHKHIIQERYLQEKTTQA